MTQNTQKGFSLIEMIVVIGIFMVISGIVLFNYDKFRSDTILTNMAYEMALTIRESQIYGVSARSNDTTPDFSGAYGVYVPGTETNQYLLFADQNDDLRFQGTTCSGQAECVTPYTLTGNVKIIRVDVKIGSGCSASTPNLNVLFRRPNPEPVINNDDDISMAQITLQSPNGSRRYVTVANNGQVSVVNQSICGI